MDEELRERFEQAATVGLQRREAPPHAQTRSSIERLESLYRDATEGDPAGREAAMRHYIELVSDLGQQGG